MFEHYVREDDRNEIIDCTFYQTAESCHAFCCPSQSILSSESTFRQMRNYFNDTRCRMLTKLIQRNVTGLELIQAFEQAPDMIENMYMSNSNMYNDKFIDQLVNVTHDLISHSPFTCMSTSRISNININDEYQCSSISSSLPKEQTSFTKIQSNPSSQQSLSISSVKVKDHFRLMTVVHIPIKSKIQSNPQPPPSPPTSRFSIRKSRPTPPVTPPPPPPRSSSSQLLSRQSSEDQPFSMGYQWKGEDN